MTEPPLEQWIERQTRISAARLARAISATSLTYERRGFGQTIRPAKGSVLASPEPASGDAGPDYFFHWLRDAATVMDAVLALMRGPEAGAWIARFEDWVQFTLDLGRIDGTAFLAAGDFRGAVAPELRRFVRPDAEIAAVAGDRVLDDVRFNADGTLDFIHWARPQHDGAALGALMALRFWARDRSTSAEARRALAALIARNLDYTAARAGQAYYDIWEEELGHHYYTALVQRTALEEGAAWMAARGERERAARYAERAARLARELDGAWSAERRIYRSRGETGAPHPKARDMSVILAVLHAGRASGPHSVLDQRASSTLAELAAMFAEDYALNRGHARPFAFGRYRGDRYFSGGAWYLCSFAAAEFHYRRAAAARAGALAEDAGALVALGDEILDAVRRYIPDTGELSEQFDQTTGAQTSARNLTWSYSAFITAADARERAVRGNR